MNKQILVITDDAQTLSVLQASIAAKPIELAHTDSIQQAAIILKQTLPDLVILDLTMKEPRTLTFLREMKMRVRFEHLPVLVMVSMPEPDIIKEALEAGADRYLTKVFISQNVVRTLHDMLAVSKAG